MSNRMTPEEGERNIRLLIAYDGTDFSGWERQRDARTVQGEIEKALEKIHKKPVALAGSGRTDAGVHAAGQAANFYSCLRNMEAPRFVPALNSILPREIRILRAEEARLGFHARFDAKFRTYRYFLVSGRPAMPWELRYAWHIRRKPCIARLNDYARLLSGEMDLTLFAATGDQSASRSRYLRGASFFVDRETLVFEITANAFLWKMVRSVLGTFLHYEEKGLPPEALGEIIASGCRSLAGPTAPPQGLFLWNVEF